MIPLRGILFYYIPPGGIVNCLCLISQILYAFFSSQRPSDLYLMPYICLDRLGIYLAIQKTVCYSYHICAHPSYRNFRLRPQTCQKGPVPYEILYRRLSFLSRQHQSPDGLQRVCRCDGNERLNDEVIILGDLSFGTAEESTALLEQLNGHLCLIQGNHDRYGAKKGYGTSRFKWIRPYTELRDNRRKVILCHYPILCYNGQYKLMEDGSPQTYMLYGHVHDTVDQRLIEDFQEKIRSTVRYDRSGHPFHIPCNLINCFCMYSDYTPLTLDEWIECDRQRMEKRKR